MLWNAQLFKKSIELNESEKDRLNFNRLIFFSVESFLAADLIQRMYSISNFKINETTSENATAQKQNVEKSLNVYEF